MTFQQRWGPPRLPPPRVHPQGRRGRACSASSAACCRSGGQPPAVGQGRGEWKCQGKVIRAGERWVPARVQPRICARGIRHAAQYTCIAAVPAGSDTHCVVECLEGTDSILQPLKLDKGVAQGADAGGEHRSVGQYTKPAGRRTGNQARGRWSAGWVGGWVQVGGWKKSPAGCGR